MSQHDYDISNGGGAAVRADINAALLAILSQNSGATAPAVTKPFMFWYDTANSLLKQRNGADTAWISIQNSSNELVTPTISGLLTSSGQIKFPATQSASSDANTLDDYEEGNWTPTITFGGNSVGVTYNATFTGGTYTKIGNRVCISGYLLLTNKGSSTGDASIGNLPFTNQAGNTKYLGVSAGGSGFTFANQFWARIAQSGVAIDLLETTTSGATSSITNADFTNNGEIYFSATYTV